MIRFEEEEPEIRVPRGVLIAAAMLILFTIAVAGFARQTGVGAVRDGVPDVGVAVAVQDLHFVDRADGGVSVIDAEHGTVVTVLAPGTNGFVRGSLRGLARERRRRGFDASAPFRVAIWPNDRITLEDLATGTVVDLVAFGPDNSAAFAALLAPRSHSLSTAR